MRNHLQKETGVTLLELLVTLVISTIVVGLISSVLISSIKYNEKTQSHINLRKEANYFISQLRQLHKGKEYSLCYEDLLSDKRVSFVRSKLSDYGGVINNCDQVNPSHDLNVEFTLTDNQNNKFELTTIIGANRPNNSPIAIQIVNPMKDESLYDFLKDKSIFMYGSNLKISGGASIKSLENGQGTIIIDNSNFNDLIFPGNTPIELKRIYINKKTNNVILASSIKLGLQKNTELINIKGNLELNNGGIEISGKNVYIDGNVNFNDSAKIFAEKVFINGNIIFKNKAANITANEIYTTGNVTKMTNAHHSSINIIHVDNIEIPPQLILKPFSFQNSNWYLKNGYISEIKSGRKLEDGMKIFTKEYDNNNYMPSADNVVIVSEGDINIGNMGGATLSGALFAPNGKVAFEGGSFKGIVIAKNGFYVNNGGAIIEYKNINKFIKDKQDFPLQ